MSYGQPQGPSVPYVNNQYCYENRLNDYQDSTEPRLLELLQKFSRSRDEFGSTLEGVIDKARSKRKRRVEKVQRSLSIGHGCEETLRLESFKVKTVDLEDDKIGAGSQGATKKFKLPMKE